MALRCKARRLPYENDPGSTQETGGHIHFTMRIDPARTLFLPVDVWDRHHIPTFLSRAIEITQEKIAPAMSAARHAGIRVVHATTRERMSGLVTVEPGEGFFHKSFDFYPGIITAIYVGFAVNRCLLTRTCGIQEAKRRKIGVLLLRDATTAVEYPETLDGLWATRVTVNMIERHLGQTALTEDFINACH